ncbi:AAEL009186-PA [Aedes aegypti]|uniref:AAEL009186-PA n=1 Tax=Aedes aegypti TaxID=7159 RepID=Q16WL8_AEDAE|nr:AAEL009186-PA [Aedes aegypti]
MIRKRPSIGQLRLLLPLLALSTGMSLAQAVKAEHKEASVDSSAILESVLCVVRSNPMQCIREQAGRMLDNWENILDEKKREMMEEADEDIQKRNEQRGLSDNDGKQTKQSPSSLMLQIEEGLDTISEFVSDGVDSYVSTGKTSKSAEEGQPKKHLHHILHKLGKRKGKKKKTYMKLFILGAALKGKIELLLKILSFKLQLKFFAVAVIGLLINIARFWIDLKRQPQPQKVIYYEHAQHQHHYDDHGDDYGGYWKRSLHGVHHEEETPGFFDRSDRSDDEYTRGAHPQQHYVPLQTPNSPSHYPYEPHSMAYHQQRPYV